MNIVAILLLKEIVQEMLQIKVDVSCRLKNGLNKINLGGKYVGGNCRKGSPFQEL